MTSKEKELNKVKGKVVNVIDENKAESEREQNELLEKFFFWRRMFATIGRLSLMQAMWREMLEGSLKVVKDVLTRRFIFWPGPIKAIVTNEKTLKNDEKLCSDMEYTMILAKMAGRSLPLVQEFLRDCFMNKKLIPVDRYLLQLPQSIIIF